MPAMIRRAMLANGRRRCQSASLPPGAFAHCVSKRVSLLRSRQFLGEYGVELLQIGCPLGGLFHQYPRHRPDMNGQTFFGESKSGLVNGGYRLRWGARC